MHHCYPFFKHVDRMKALIEDLLSFSRVTTRGKPFEKISMDRMVEIAIDNLSILIDTNKAKIQYGSLPIVRGDATQLILVFQNLIANAIKFKKDDSPIIKISALEKENSYIFSVKDNGIGIDKEYFDRIFVIFQRLHSKQKYPGTGIGLKLTKEFVKMHMGKIWVESELDKGAKFVFTLPKDLYYKIFEVYLNDILNKIIKEISLLSFIMIKIENSEVIEKQKGKEEYIQIKEDLEQLINNCLYKLKDRVFSFKTGFCVVISGDNDQENFEIVINRLKKNINDYCLDTKIEKLSVKIEMFIYPKESETKGEIITRLKKFGLCQIDT